ncbi:hypothetical protein MAPG_07830 [Magnaporthiopsis poae ATCC 64411]|uniref:Nephrocystin 3-like N-terminal domain-containing protein n=1 Tax=Magnaporthiopsis poae (strain ATCC 64411 / 73-15) TaxID=644358 RepID=A0A0C4E5Q6_MAGP6|nr:hypothetical protein MAPG_07830 [Magnaporthiopsis poae ATCC 64411]
MMPDPSIKRALMQLEVLYPISENPGTKLPDVDVVLVHGLDSVQDDDNGNRIKTWTAEDGTVWPRDLLPEFVPNIRALCYQYYGSIQGTTSRAGIEEHARALLQQLRQKHPRGFGYEKQRPIIFVGHSLGGVIIKQALIWTHLDPEYTYLGRATCGVIFFATPHRLGGPEAGERFAERILHAVVTQQGKPGPGAVDAVMAKLRRPPPSSVVIQEIKSNSKSLTRVTTEFQAVLKSLNVSVVNFYEGQATKGLDGVVVSETDVLLDGADTQLLPADHVGICRFCKDPSGRRLFEPVWKAFERLATGANGKPESYRAALLKSLCTNEFHEYSKNIRPTKGTCRWIQEKDEFRNWQNRTARKLWIHSNPAAGKTHLAKYIINIKWAGVGVVSCFLDGRLKERNSCDAIFRSTIHQLATIYPWIWNDPVLWSDSSRSSKEVLQPGVPGADGTTASWTREELMSLWKDMVAPAATNGNGLVIIVDGFDNIPADDQEEFLDCLEECEEELSSRGLPDLRILVLSRWCFSLANEGRGFVEYEIGEQDNFEDIHRTIKIEVSRFAGVAKYSGDFQKVVCDKVARGAKGIYLWATVLVADIKAQMPAAHQLQEQLNRLPRSLAELFDSILGRIKSNQGDSAGLIVRRVLLWVVFGLEPLELHELNVGLTLAKLLEEDSKKPIDNKLLEEHMTRPEIFKAYLISLCGQLLSFSSTNHVNPVHGTLTTYLITTPDTYKNDTHKDWEVPNHASFYVDDHKAHARLGNMCAAYLMMPSFADAGDRYEPTEEGQARWEVKVRTRVEGNQLVKYAALCWSRHFRAAGLAEQGLQGHEMLRNVKTEFGISWSEVWWFERRWRGFNFPRADEDLVRLMLNAEKTENSLVPPKEQIKRQAKQKPGEPGEPIDPAEDPAEAPTDRLTGQPADDPAGDTAGGPAGGPAGAPTEAPTEAATGQQTGHLAEDPAERPKGHLKEHPAKDPAGDLAEDLQEDLAENPAEAPIEAPIRRPTSHLAGHPADEPTGQSTGQQKEHPADELVGQPVDQPANQLADQPANQPAEDLVKVLAEPPTGQSVGQPTDRPTRRPAEDPTKGPAEPPAGDPAGDPAADPAGDLAGVPQGDPAKDPAEPPAKEPIGQSTGQPEGQPVDRPADGPARQPAKDPAKDPAEPPAGDLVGDLAGDLQGDLAKDPAKDPPGELMKKPTETLPENSSSDDPSQSGPASPEPPAGEQTGTQNPQDEMMSRGRPSRSGGTSTSRPPRAHRLRASVEVPKPNPVLPGDHSALPDRRSSDNTSRRVPASPRPSTEEQPGTQPSESSILPKTPKEDPGLNPVPSGNPTSSSPIFLPPLEVLPPLFVDPSRPLGSQPPSPGNPLPLLGDPLPGNPSLTLPGDPSLPSHTLPASGDNQTVPENRPARTGQTPPTSRGANTPPRITPPPAYPNIGPAPPPGQTPLRNEQNGTDPAPSTPPGKPPSDDAGTPPSSVSEPHKMTWWKRLCWLLTCGCCGCRCRRRSKRKAQGPEVQPGHTTSRTASRSEKVA